MNFHLNHILQKHNVSAVPSSLDWRTKGAITLIKDQGQCVAATDGITKPSSGKLISLSEQESVDCDVERMDQGCSDGLMDNAFDFIINMQDQVIFSNHNWVQRLPSYMTANNKRLCNSVEMNSGVFLSRDLKSRLRWAPDLLDPLVDAVAKLGGTDKLRFCKDWLDHSIFSLGSQGFETASSNSTL